MIDATEPVHIRLYLHCRQCGLELPADESIESFARLSAGLTSDGQIAILCVRHRLAVGSFRLHPDIARHLDALACEKEH